MPECDICNKVITVKIRAISAGIEVGVCKECLKYCEKEVKIPKKPVKKTIKIIKRPKPVIPQKPIIPQRPKPVKIIRKPPKPIVRERPKFVATKKSNIYHDINCRMVRFIKKENMIFFKSLDEPRRLKGKPCKVCKPPF